MLAGINIKNIENNHSLIPIDEHPNHEEIRENKKTELDKIGDFEANPEEFVLKQKYIDDIFVLAVKKNFEEIFNSIEDILVVDKENQIDN